MKGWIKVTEVDDKKPLTTAINVKNITHVKDMSKDNYIAGQTKIFISTSNKDFQRNLDIKEAFDTVLESIERAEVA